MHKWQNNNISTNVRQLTTKQAHTATSSSKNNKFAQPEGINNQTLKKISQCTLSLSHKYNTNYPFNCSQVPIQHNTTSLCKKPLEAPEVIKKCKFKMTFLRVTRWLLQDILGGGAKTILDT